MRILKDLFGGKKPNFTEMDDNTLLDHLAELVITLKFSEERSIRSILSVVFDRVAENTAAHPALIPVAKQMAFLEELIPTGNFGVAIICGWLANGLQDHYNGNHPDSFHWRSLNLV